MKYLAVDTSGKNLTVVIMSDGKSYEYFDENCGVEHSVQIMPVIEDLVVKSGIKLEEVDFFACVVGAGSFTGIRIGVATVKALAYAFNKPVLSLTSFDVLAYNKNSGKNLAVIDAKHNSYYVSGYDGEKVVFSPSFIDKEELIKLSREFNIVSSEEIDGFDCEKVSLLNGLIKAIEIKKQFVNKDINSLSPLYIRKSQAEEGR